MKIEPTMRHLCLIAGFLLSMFYLNGQNLNDGLLLHYSLDNGEAIDQSGNGIDGTVVGPTSTGDRFGAGDQALDFDLGDYVEFPSDPSLEIQWPFSISAWVYFQGDDANQSIFRTNWTENNYSGIAFGAVSNSKIVVTTGANLGNTGDGNRLSITTDDTGSIPEFTWTHVAAIYENPTSGRIFIDGCEYEVFYRGNGPTTIGYSGAPGRLGIHDTSTSTVKRELDGSIDEVYFWDRAITEAEVQLLYDRFKVPQVDLGMLEDCSSVSVSVTDSLENVEWSNATSGNTATFDQDGVYTMRGEYNCHIVTDTFEVQLLSSTSVDLGEDISLCQDSVDLSVNGTYTEIVWSTGASTPSISVSASGTYSVTVVDDCGESSDEIEVTLDSSPSIDLDQEYIICDGETLTLNLVATVFDQITWSTGSTASSIELSQAGVYSVTATSGMCPEVSASFTLEVAPSYSEAKTFSLCPGESINLYGQEISAVGSYTFPFTTTQGCDSTIITEVVEQECEECDPIGRRFMRAALTAHKGTNGLYNITARVMNHSYAYHDLSLDDAIAVAQAYTLDYTLMSEHGKPEHLAERIADINLDYSAHKAHADAALANSLRSIAKALQTQRANTKFTIKK